MLCTSCFTLTVVSHRIAWRGKEEKGNESKSTEREKESEGGKERDRQTETGKEGETERKSEREREREGVVKGTERKTDTE